MVSKLFRAYGLYNQVQLLDLQLSMELFQSSFELTGYITWSQCNCRYYERVSKLFRAYGLYNQNDDERAECYNI